jgi:hypothetical protein
MKEKAQKLINGMVSVWIRNDYSKKLAEILENETENIIPEVSKILGQKRKGDKTKYDEARSFIIGHVSEKYNIRPRREHFVKDDDNASSAWDWKTMIVDKAKDISRADAGTLYILDKHLKGLWVKVFQNDTLSIRMSGNSDEIVLPKAPFRRPFVPLYKNGELQISSHVALTGKTLNISDCYEAEGFDFTDVRDYDQKNGYRSKSMLVTPLKNDKNEITGVLQLLNAKNERGEVVSFSSDYEGRIVSLAFQVARTDNSDLSNIKDKETIEIISEDPFYEKLVSEYQNELAGIILPCIQNYEHFIDFLRFFIEGLEKDIAERFKAMLWFASLLTELATTDTENVCEKGSDYLKTKLKELLDCALEEKIMLPDGETEENDYDRGMWNESIFALLQGEDRKQFLEKIVRQFNFDEKGEHSTRLLLSKHRNCMSLKTIEIFCNKERTE